MTMYLYLHWWFFFMKNSWTNSLDLSFSLEWGIAVQRVAKSHDLMLLQEERDLEYMYSNKSDSHHLSRS
jgi:hypothetical protein